MAVYYPQCYVKFQITWETFDRTFASYNNFLGPDGKSFIVTPMSVSIDYNDYSAADTFSIVVDYKQLPFDPRVFRALAVRIYAADKKQVIKDGRINEIAVGGPNVHVFEGYVDTVKLSHRGMERSVMLEGRDLTSLLIDRPRVSTGNNAAPPEIKKNIPVDQLINSLLREQRSFNNFRTFVPPEVRKSFGGTLPQLSQVESKNVLELVANNNQEATYWSIIRAIADAAGLICYVQSKSFFEGDDEFKRIVLTQPRNLYDTRKYVQMIYGRNLKSLDFERTTGRQNKFNIQVFVTNPDTKKRLVANLPEDAKDAEFIATFGKKRIKVPVLDTDGNVIEPQGENDGDAPFYRFPVAPGSANTTEDLIRVGEYMYAELSRQEIRGSLETAEMEFPLVRETDTGTAETPLGRGRVGESTDRISFRDITTGTALQIVYATDDLNQISQKADKAIRKRYLEDRGFNPELAEAFASRLDQLGNVFYTKSVGLNFTEGLGFTLGIEFQNIIDLGKIPRTRPLSLGHG